MIPPEEALAFIWSGQNGLAEVATEVSKREHLPPEHALGRLREYRFFAPMLRIWAGSTKKAVAPSGNVLWADIDSRDGLARISERLRKGLGVDPSLIVDSTNKGFWVYLKLDRHIPSHEVELLNKRLGLHLDADPGAWNRDRLARIPGSVHERSKCEVKIVDLSGVVHDPTMLDRVLPHIPTPLSSSENSFEYLNVRSDGDGYFREWPPLSEELQVYIHEHPGRGEGYDRSAVEQKVFSILVARNWTDEEIIAFSNKARLPRHIQELARHRDYRWTLRSIQNARKYSLEKGASTSNLSQVSTSSSNRFSSMCMRSDTYHHLDLFSLLKHIHDGMTVSEVVATAEDCLHVSRSTVLRALKGLEQGEYIHSERNGRTRLILLTDKGRDVTSRRVRPPIVVPRIQDLKSDDKVWVSR